jgi:hypothetical protein
LPAHNVGKRLPRLIAPSACAFANPPIKRLRAKSGVALRRRRVRCAAECTGNGFGVPARARVHRLPQLS